MTPRASLLAALAVAFSPAFAHTSHQVLSDGPAVAVTLFALWAGAAAIDSTSARRGAAAGFASGALLAFATGLREQSVFFAVSLAWFALVSRSRVRVAIAMTLGFGLVAAITAWLALRIEPDWFAHIRAWREAMRHERALHEHGLRDVAMYLAWVFALGPAAVIAAAIAWSRDRSLHEVRRSALAAVCVPSLAQLALLAAYQDIAYSPRYLLPALAGAIAIPAARWADAMLARTPPRAVSLALALVIAPAALAAPFLRAREAPLRTVLDATPALLANLPDDALVVTGQACGEVMLARRIVVRTSSRTVRWRSVCPGWSWPANLAAYLDERDERVIAVDLRRGGWIGAGQETDYETASAYVRAHADAVARGEIVVWR
jgi:4-amino-4-deoxy-L-arabinose transferase-like glycosyltransferase